MSPGICLLITFCQNCCPVCLWFGFTCDQTNPQEKKLAPVNCGKEDDLRQIVNILVAAVKFCDSVADNTCLTYGEQILLACMKPYFSSQSTIFCSRNSESTFVIIKFSQSVPLSCLTIFCVVNSSNISSF